MVSIVQEIENSIVNGPLIIESTGILDGANYFSSGRVIRIRLNLKQYDEVFTNEIPNFYEELKKRVPSLLEHHCSYGFKGGFFKRVEEGTLLGHVVEHTALELQNLAEMDINFGKTRETKEKGVYNVVFRFLDEQAGLLAGKGSTALINSILTGSEFNVQELINQLIELKEQRLLGFSTQSIADKARERNIPFLRIDKYNRVQLGTGMFKKLIRATVTENTGLIAVETSDNKFATSSILSESGIPVPEQELISNIEQAKSFLARHSTVVLKPLVGRRGHGVNVSITDNEQLEKAFIYSSKFDKDLIVQEHIPGNLYRLLIINHQLVAAVNLIPACIMGDGIKNIAQLIEDFNNQADRGWGDSAKLARIIADEDTLTILSLKNYDLNSVLALGEKLVLKNTGNIRLGSTAVDITAQVHEYNRFVCERISHLINLDVVGIDIISHDISQAINENKGVVIDVNAAPDFKIHLNPNQGKSQPVNEYFVEMLFPKNAPSHIPLISVTGSSGKTLYTELIEKYFKKKGIYAGCLRTNGLFVNGRQIKTVDIFHSNNVSLLLKDPTLEAAVVETPVETVLNYGLGYEYADFGVVLALDERDEYYTYDHIRDIEDVAYAKSVVAEQVYTEGYTILNADNPLIYEMTERLYSRPAFISLEKPKADLLKNFKLGEPIAYFDNEVLTITSGGTNTLLFQLNEIPYIDKNNVNSQYATLAAALTLYLMGEKKEMMEKILVNKSEE